MTDFFIKGRYSADINTDNPLGRGGYAPLASCNEKRFSVRAQLIGLLDAM
jgi:hypothetical protein